MSERILSVLRRRLEELGGRSGMASETKRNVLKEELQHYVLNFIYHHPEYAGWIMYGGSALRMIHGLGRMSVDLDFEIPRKITDGFLETLKKEIGRHFTNAYGAASDFLAVKTTKERGVLLKFNIGRELNLGHPSNQVHVKVDLNSFAAPGTVAERRPINHGQLSFVINTYRMSTLMASKIAAIFLRGTREVGKEMFEEKGRDIYDLLWYMNKKAVPDLAYLAAKGVDIRDLRDLFDKMTVRMNQVNDNNLRQDLMPLFVDNDYIGNWLKNWRESYMRLLEKYEINTIAELESVRIYQDFRTDTYSIIYLYRTREGGTVRIVFKISDYWMEYSEGDLKIEVNENIIKKTEGELEGRLSDRLKRYVTLFYKKAESYLNNKNRIVLGDNIDTKLIRMTAANLNQKEEILLNKSALLSCSLDNLLR